MPIFSGLREEQGGWFCVTHNGPGNEAMGFLGLKGSAPFLVFGLSVQKLCARAGTDWFFDTFPLLISLLGGIDVI